MSWSLAKGSVFSLACSIFPFPHEKSCVGRTTLHWCSKAKEETVEGRRYSSRSMSHTSDSARTGADTVFSSRDGELVSVELLESFLRGGWRDFFVSSFVGEAGVGSSSMDEEWSLEGDFGRDSRALDVPPRKTDSMKAVDLMTV